MSQHDGYCNWKQAPTRKSSSVDHEMTQRPPFTGKRDTAIHARGQELVQLASQYFPQEFDVTGDDDAWPLVGAALVSRMIGTLKAILALHPAELEADAGALVRNLFETLVTLAWLAADSTGGRMREWRKDDLKSRLKMDADARSRGAELLTDAERTAMQAQVDGLPGDRLALPNLAEVADRYWAGKLPGSADFGHLLSFRGLYTIIFRNYSGFTHATYRGINSVFDNLGSSRRRVRLEDKYEGRGPYGVATVIFGFALLIAAQTLGWPKAAEVHEIFARHPDANGEV